MDILILMKYSQHPVVEKENFFPVSSLSRLIEDPKNPGTKIEFYDLVNEYNIKWKSLWNQHIGYSVSTTGSGEWTKRYPTRLQGESPEISDLLFVDHKDQKK